MRPSAASCVVHGLAAAFLLASVAAAQTPPKPATAAAPAAPAAPKPAAAPRAASGVDTVIALVKGGMSEALVVRTLQREGKA